MECSILINQRHGETRVAVLEDGELTELYVERDEDRGIVGNIYKGRVTRVLPGMQAAFVNIGLARAAFLYVDDVLRPDEPSATENRADGEREPEKAASEAAPELPHGAERQSEVETATATATATATEDEDEDEAGPGAIDKPTATAAIKNITQLLRPGQEILVQVTKEPRGTKGARISMYITVPGRFVVHLPTTNRVGVSRKIENEAERKRLRAILESARRPAEGGFIARTACESLTEAELQTDVAHTRVIWSHVLERSRHQAAPSLLRAELDLPLRIARDVLAQSAAQILVDDAATAEEMRSLLSLSSTTLADRVHVYLDAQPIFEKHDVEGEIERSLLRDVPLKSGGSLVIDETEALTAIDVNTGSFVGSRDLELTVKRTNLEAAKEIPLQIRLRNLAGLIIVDFIDMQDASSREQVYRTFCAELAKDRAKVHVLPMSELGLVEMTRRRLRRPLSRVMSEPCPYCEGRGRIRSRRTMCQDIYREIERQARIHPEGTIIVRAMPQVAAVLSDDAPHQLEALERKLNRSVVVEAESELHQEVFHVSIRTSQLPEGQRGK